MVPGSGTAGSFSWGAPKICSTFAILMPRLGREGPDIACAGMTALVVAGAVDAAGTELTVAAAGAVTVAGCAAAG